jgi:hypothetical protein
MEKAVRLSQLQEPEYYFCNGYKTFEYAGDNPWEKNSIRIRLLLLKNY